MFVGMRVKTSVTIDEGLLRAIDKATSRVFAPSNSRFG